MPCPRRFSCHETFFHTMSAQVFIPRNIFVTPCSRKFSCMCPRTSHATNTFVELRSCAPPSSGRSPAMGPGPAWAWARLGPGPDSGQGPLLGPGPLPDSGPEAEFQDLEATEGKIKGSACQILGSGGQILELAARSYDPETRWPPDPMGTNMSFPQEVLRKGVGLPQVASSRSSQNGQALAQVGCSTDFGNEQVFTQVVGSRCFEKGHVLPQMEYSRRFETQQYFYPRRLFIVLWKQTVVPPSSFPQVLRKRASFSYIHMACSRCFKDG